MVTQPRSRRAVALSAAALVAVFSFLSVPSQAMAASGPTVTDTTPTSTVKSVVDASSSGASAQALPTAQIDGVVWSEAVVGDTVYAGGNFANARPAGAAAGTNTVARTDLLAFSISTGVLNTSFAPTLNGQVKAVAVSPDGSTLYVGGDFTTVNGSSRTRIAAFNVSTGALVSTFAPTVNGSVLALAVTNSTVYAGGSFTTVNGKTTTRLAAFSASTGALTSWSASADGQVDALVLTPDGTRVIAGGAFQNVNSSAAYGLAALNSTTGALLTWNATKVVQDAGKNSAILSLSTDGTAVYGTGYVFGAGGNLEGAFSADPDSGTLNWLEDCHGDSYGTYATGSQVYVVSHEHYCGNIGAFGESNPRSWHRATAFTTKATGTITPDTQGYANFAGNASPSMVNWFPDLAAGTFTGQSQAAWSITGNGTYVVLGGEFPTVNGAAQQGLVRFATRATAASKQGPVATGSALAPRVLPVSPTAATISFQPDYDRDNTQLTYSLVMNGAKTTPVWSGTVQSTFWARPAQSLSITGLTAGTKYTFALTATDPDGNTVTGSTVTYTAPTTTTALATYSSRVESDGATSYYPLDDTAGTSVKDYPGFLDGVLTGSDASTSTGVLAGDAGTTLSGTTTLAQSGYDIPGPSTYSEQIWIRTTTTAGGPIMEFGDGTGTTTDSHDREVYMGTDGRVNYSVYTASGTFATVTSKSALNDGQWHQITATEGSSGTALYVDGALAGSTTSNTSPSNNYSGYWRLGAENLNGAWPSSSGIATGFAGDVDEWAIYPTALSAATVQSEYAARTSG